MPHAIDGAPASIGQGSAERRSPTLATLNAHGLAAILHVTAATVWNALSTNPQRLPPPVKIPGAGETLWLESTVLQWLQDREIRPKPRRGRPTKRQQIERAAATAVEAAT